MFPGARTITPTLQGQLLLSKQLSKQAQRATAMLALKSSSLVSLGQLCDDNCTVILNKKQNGSHKRRRNNTPRNQKLSRWFVGHSD